MKKESFLRKAVKVITPILCALTVTLAGFSYSTLNVSAAEVGSFTLTYTTYESNVNAIRFNNDADLVMVKVAENVEGTLDGNTYTGDKYAFLYYNPPTTVGIVNSTPRYFYNGYAPVDGSGGGYYNYAYHIDDLSPDLSAYAWSTVFTLNDTNIPVFDTWEDAKEYVANLPPAEDDVINQSWVSQTVELVRSVMALFTEFPLNVLLIASLCFVAFDLFSRARSAAV